MSLWSYVSAASPSLWLTWCEMLTGESVQGGERGGQPARDSPFSFTFREGAACCGTEPLRSGLCPSETGGCWAGGVRSAVTACWPQLGAGGHCPAEGRAAPAPRGPDGSPQQPQAWPFFPPQPGLRGSGTQSPKAGETSRKEEPTTPPPAACHRCRHPDRSWLGHGEELAVGWEAGF